MAHVQRPEDNSGFRQPSSHGDARPDVTIVIPMHNEEAAVADLVSEIVQIGASLPPYELIVVDDGSTDATLKSLFAAQSICSQLRIIRHEYPGGQSAAIHSAIMAARSPICLTLDGDGQNPPSELPKLYAALAAADAARIGLVAGQRVGRKDPLTKRLASRFANSIRGMVLQDGTRDTGCGLKCFRTEAYRELPYFDHMHRYLPALFRAYGWGIRHVDVAHRQRKTGRSKYSNLQRGIQGVWDLLGVMWLIRRAKKNRRGDIHVDA